MNEYLAKIRLSEEIIDKERDNISQYKKCYVEEYTKQYSEYIGKKVRINFSVCSAEGYLEGFDDNWKYYYNDQMPEPLLYKIKKDGSKSSIRERCYGCCIIDSIEILD